MALKFNCWLLADPDIRIFVLSALICEICKQFSGKIQKVEKGTAGGMKDIVVNQEVDLLSILVLSPERDDDGTGCRVLGRICDGCAPAPR